MFYIERSIMTPNDRPPMTEAWNAQNRRKVRWRSFALYLGAWWIRIAIKRVLRLKHILVCKGRGISCEIFDVLPTGRARVRRIGGTRTLSRVALVRFRFVRIPFWIFVLKIWFTRFTKRTPVTILSRRGHDCRRCVADFVAFDPLTRADVSTIGTIWRVYQDEKILLRIPPRQSVADVSE